MSKRRRKLPAARTDKGPPTIPASTETLPGDSPKQEVSPEKHTRPAQPVTRLHNGLDHNQIFWVFTIIIGLSIRQAIQTTVPDLLPGSQKFGLPPMAPAVEAVRLVVFIATTVRFYLGAVRYFQEVHIEPNSAAEYPRSMYSMDYVSGLIHFLFFYGWSLTLADHGTYFWGLSQYLLMLVPVLLYDIVWYVVNAWNDSCRRIGFWTFMNFVTVLAAGVLFLASPSSIPSHCREWLALTPVAIWTLLDLSDILAKKPFLIPWIQRHLPPFRSP